MSCFKYLSFFLILFCFLCQKPFAQTYNNEWIDFEQTYFKIKVAKSGLYRIPFSSLQNTTLPLTADGFQLYNKGKQVPIYLTTNGTLNSEDYIELLFNSGYSLHSSGQVVETLQSDYRASITGVSICDAW